MPKNLGVDTFPDPVCHFGAPWRPFWILQAVRRCRRWASAPCAARLVLFLHSYPSVFYFAKLKHQRTFHHLLLILAVVDTVHLVSSSITFSIPFLSESFSNNLWKYLVPYTLALAQVTFAPSYSYSNVWHGLDQHDCQRVYDLVPHHWEVLLCCLSFHAFQEEVSQFMWISWLYNCIDCFLIFVSLFAVHN